MSEKYYVQETIGGWRQTALFEGTYDECQEYMESVSTSSSISIVSEADYEVDYL